MYWLAESGAHFDEPRYLDAAERHFDWVRALRDPETGFNGDPRCPDAALRAIDGVKAAQPLANPDPGIRGGLPGSSPPWGECLRLALPEGSAKSWVDALCEKRKALARSGR